MRTPAPNPNATVLIENHEGDWREELRYAILSEGANFIVTALHEVIVENGVLPERRERWTVYRGSALGCRKFCLENDIVPHLDYST